MKTEFEVGEVFQCGLMKLKCVEGKRCTDCFFDKFDDIKHGDCLDIIGACWDEDRKDGKEVIFVKAED